MKINLNKNNLFFTSDWHLNHKNICKNISEWKETSKCRNFDSVEDMNSHIIDSINEQAKENDYIVNLGDFLFNKTHNLEHFLNRINCKNIIFIKGNHDNFTEEEKNMFFFYDKSIEQLQVVFPNEKGDGHYKPNFFLSHYPHLSWHKQHRGFIHLHGHSHGNLKLSFGKMLDVGIDNAYKLFKEYRMFSVKEVYKLMENKDVLKTEIHR